MIKGANAVLSYFDQVNSINDNTYKYFTVYRKGQLEKGNAAITTPKDRSDWTFQQARELLSQWLHMQQFGEFTIVINDHEKSTVRGNMRQDFSIEYGGMNSNPVVSGPSFSQEDIEARITKAVSDALTKDKQEREHKELQAKVAELTKENKELERKAGDPWNKFIGAIEPYIPNILEEQGIIKNKVAGPNTAATHVDETDPEHPANDVGEVDADKQQRIEIACRKFHQARPNDWLEVLEFFADKLLAKPSLVETAKSFL